MNRSLLAAVAVCLAVAASSSAGEIRGTPAPVADSYIVVFEPGAVSNVPAAAQSWPRPTAAP